MPEYTLARKGRDEKPDLAILGAVALLLVGGLIMVYSAQLYFDHGLLFLGRQATRIGIGLVLMLIGFVVPLRVWRTLALPLMILLTASLILVWLFGGRHLGAARTLFGIQPSEFAKPLLVLFLANYYRRHDHLPESGRTFRRVALYPMLCVAPVLALIVMQPAVSMASICALIVFTLMYLAEVRWSQILGAVLVCAVVGGVSYAGKSYIDSRRARTPATSTGEEQAAQTRTGGLLAMAQTAVAPSSTFAAHSGGGKFQHVFRRLRAYLNWVTHVHEVRDQLWHASPVVEQIDWQQRQSWIAIGSGGFTGKGLGNGKQKLHFLPKVHTDFVFGLVGEEFGFLGSLVVFALFLFVLWRGVFLALRAQDTFSRLLTAGLVLTIVLTAIVHLGVTLHLLPPTGQTLPLISYGGSALAANMFGVGLILQLSKHILRRPVEDDMVSRIGHWWTHLSGARAS